MHRIVRVLAGTFALVMTGLLPDLARAESYRLDSLHSFIAFEVRHLDVTNAWGLAVGPTGSFVIDKADPTKSTFQVEVKAESIVTGNSQRDNHLKGPDFFDARQFPTISFKSKSVKMNGENYEVTGDFMLHGVTKSITVMIAKTGERDAGGPNGYRVGLGTKFTIKRTDFGMTGLLNLAGDDVTLHVNLEGQRQ